jgi:hypothetical protein
MMQTFLAWVGRLIDRVMSSVIGAIPTLDNDGGICSVAQTAGGMMSSVTWLVPGPALLTAFTMILATLGAVLIIQLVRLVASFMTGGGGATS